MGASDFLRSAAASLFDDEPQQKAPEQREPPEHQQAFAGSGGGPVDEIMSAVGHYAEGGAVNAGLFDFFKTEKPAKANKGIGDAYKKIEPGLDKQIEKLKKEQAEAKAKEQAQIEAEAKNDPQFKKDPEGARKRAAEFVDAKKDLDGMFDIVGDKVPEKNRKQNELTDKEFREMAKRYADIKAGRGDLKLETVPGSSPQQQAKDRKAMLGDIARIMQTKSGRGLISSLHDNKGAKGTHRHTTTIRPGASFDSGTSGKGAGGLTHDVQYEPGKVANEVRAKDHEQWAHLMRSDVVLYHELTHAYHASHYDGAGRNEEHQTVGLGDYAPGGTKAHQFSENRYRSERNDVTGRGRYTDAPISDEMKQRYPDWKSWLVDGKLKPRPKYSPDVD